MTEEKIIIDEKEFIEVTETIEKKEIFSKEDIETDIASLESALTKKKDQLKQFK